MAANPYHPYGLANPYAPAPPAPRPAPRPSRTTGPLLVTSLRDKTLMFVVVEDDDQPCPRSQTAIWAYDGGSLDQNDDLIGKSESFEASQLAEPMTLSFDEVLTLSVHAELD